MTPLNFLLILYLKLLLFVTYVSSLSKHPLVLIVSFDGFRHNYLNSELTPVLYKLRSEGAYSDYMVNIFPTKTYPNHHSIVTGLYAEDHDVLDNKMFDATTNTNVGYSQKMFVKDGVWPLTILNEYNGAGRHSGSMMWPGSDYAYNGINLTYNHFFERNVSWTDRVDEVVGWFLKKDKPANLVTLYFDEPDSSGHMTGANSEAVKVQVRRCDNITNYLLKQLDKFNLSEKMNLFFMSDHGMTSVQVRHLIDLTKIIDKDDVTFGGGSPTLEIFPVKGKEDKVYETLSKAANDQKTFQVYKKENIPNRWRYKKSHRAPPMLAVANLTFAFQDLWRDFEWFAEYNLSVTVDSLVGLHGYDNNEPDMWPFFLASGPLIRKNTKVSPPFQNVDLYELWCYMLKLGRAPNALQTAGNLRQVKSMLAPEPVVSGSSVSMLSIGLYFCLVSSLVSLGVK